MLDGVTILSEMLYNVKLQSVVLNSVMLLILKYNRIMVYLVCLSIYRIIQPSVTLHEWMPEGVIL